MTTSIRDIIADFALGKYKEMCNDELIDTMNRLMYIIDEDTTPEEKIALKKPYWSLVYRIANKKGLMWELPKKRKEEKEQKEEKKEEKKPYKNRFIIKDKKAEETKPKKEDN